MKQEAAEAAPAPKKEESKAQAATLSASALKKISQVSGNNQQAIKELDALVRKYSNGAMTAEGFYKELLKICGGSKDIAFDIFPELIGSLPRGESKSRLSQFFSQYM